jgi:hypothetical protein
MNRANGPRLATFATLLWLASYAPLPASADGGTWTAAPANTAAGGQAFGLWMMTDGKVLSHGSALNHWVLLSPDRKGDYSKGTWKAAASSSHARGGAQQHMLKDGRFFQAGGEYVDGPACTPALCKGTEIYDPVADKWTDVAPGMYEIADTGSATLPDGRILDSNRAGKNIQIYDPTMDKWIDNGTFPLANGDENSWVSLQNGGILAVGYKSDGAAIYNIATNKWTRTGPVPSGFNTGDTAGISLMFDGRVLVYGIGQMYIYTPGPTGADPGTWALGPKTLKGYEAEDEFSNTLPNGKVWSGLVSMTYGPGLILQEFDPTTNTVVSAPPPPDKGNPYPIGYVNLPNGQVMVTCEQNDWIYTPADPPNDDWRPTVSSVVYNSANKTYTLTGTQISGLINGSDEGDDMTNAQNYPIVWLKDDTDNVYYCRSFNFSNMAPSKGDTPETCDFTTPPDLPDGTYSLYVSALGVISKQPLNFKVGVGGKADGTVPTTGGAGAGAAGAAAGAGGAGGAIGSAGAFASAGSGAQASAGNASSAGAAAIGGRPASAGAAGTSTSFAGSGALGSAGSTSGAAAPHKSGCSCHVVAGGTTQSTGWASLGVLGLVALRARRRGRKTARHGVMAG